MKNILFASVNGQNILGEDVLTSRKRLLSELEPESTTFVSIPNEENNSFLNAEALQKTIQQKALVALAKFEGIEVSEEELSQTIYELRSAYDDEVDWVTSLDDLGIDDKNIREVFYRDLMIDRLLQSHLELFEVPDSEKAEEFYQQNLESMKINDSYTFIELEIKNSQHIKIAADILAQNDTTEIIKKAQNYGWDAVLNESIRFQQLPVALQEMMKDLPEQKIGTLPLEDESLVFVKLLQKIPGKQLSLEDALPGLIEYLKYQQYKDLLDELTDLALDKSDIQYHNIELLKQLK
ncbi:MAG: hypothetical protein ACRCWI_04915 [Brevinema sp.]